jgi:Mesyanzhinovviridae DNA primase
MTSAEAVRIAPAPAGPATQLVSMYAEGTDEAVVAAGKLTLAMIAETATWFDALGDVRAGEKVRAWWIKQVRGVDEEDAAELEERWAVAFEKAKGERKPAAEPKPAKTYREIKQEIDGAERRARERVAEENAGADAELAAEARAEELPRAGLPALVPPPPPLQPPKPSFDEAVTAMNSQHAIIENVGGKTMIASWEPSSVDPTKLEVVFQSKESFLLRYSNRFVLLEEPSPNGGTRTISRALGQWWLSHRDRMQFRGVTFQPGGAKIENDCLNLWQGWGVEAEPGDWSLIRSHIVEVIAGGNAEFAEYVIRWVAWSIQNPAAQAEVALVLIGEKGAGKGTLVRCLQRMFGRHAFQVNTREHVIDKFNGHLRDCVLFIADEAYWGGDKRCVGRLQGMITEPTLSIERKGMDVVEVPNYLHIVMLAEPGWVIPAGRFERRYAALTASTSRRGDREYFRALHHQIKEMGGVEAMFFDLARLPLDGWHPREIPESLLRGAALQEQQVLNLPPWEQWYMMLLHNAALPRALNKRPNTAYTGALLESARAAVARLRWDASVVALRNFLTDADRLGIICIKYRTSSANGWSFPPLQDCRAAWEKRYGPVKWDVEAEDWSGG